MIGRALRHLLLPPTVSEFERHYLGRMNRIALVFFCAHLPLMVVVAALCGTSLPQAVAFTVAVLVGPVVAYRSLSNPRAIARVMAFAAMCMGGVLVHVGQGPMQIEMHFYFFVLIALLAAFADPLVIIVAAVTVALHHAAVYALVPASVFNYEASIWAVVVHALFVVLESVAACFVARSFFDNVIGLERIVGARTRELASRNEQMRAVLDNVAAGLVTVDFDGTMSVEMSAAVERWLGPCEPGEPIWAYVGRIDAESGLLMEMAWETLRSDATLAVLALEQCPRRISAGPRTLSLGVSILDGQRRVLLMMTDVTDEMVRQQLEREQCEIVTLCERAVRDPVGIAEFLRETGVMVEAIAHDLGGDELLRILHTVKGNASTSGATSVADLCHDIESRIAEEGSMRAADRCAIHECWTRLASRMSMLRGGNDTRLRVEPGEHAAVVEELRRGRPPLLVAESIDAWRLERAEERLARLADQATSLAQRLGREGLEVVIDGADLRLPDRDLSSLWASFTHVVRNAVDHGIEPAEERLARGKRAAGRLALRARRAAGGLVIEVEDDGRGIDWARVAKRAEQLGIPAASEAELKRALFADGLSTRDTATSTSGRGVGMSAVRAECERIGAELTIAPGGSGGTLVSVFLKVPSIRCAA